jgi:V/A-type H+-transporting ATPase subunit E
MGLEKVKDEILNNANREAEKLKESANEEVKKIMNSTEEKVLELNKKASDETKSIIQSLKNRENASTELDLKKLSLDSKKEMVELVFKEAKIKISKLSEAKRKEIIKRLFEKAKNEIEIKTVYCNKKDSKFFEGFKVKVEDILGGLIAENEDGSVRVDYNFDSLLQNLRENYLQDISKILFD